MRNSSMKKNKKQTNETLGNVLAHQDITSNVFNTHDGPVEKCVKCQKHPLLIEWNRFLKEHNLVK